MDGEKVRVVRGRKEERRNWGRRGLGWKMGVEGREGKERGKGGEEEIEWRIGVELVRGKRGERKSLG